MKRFILACVLSLLSLPALANLCLLGAINSTCTFATDTSGGQALYTNPANLANIGSGVINPFLGTQVNGDGGTEFGVSTDIPQVNQLPLDDKRDNANTFTNTFRLNQLGVVTVGGKQYYSFFLDINEPGNDEKRFLSLDTLRVWGRTGADAADPFLATKFNVTQLSDVDLFPNLSLVYALGPLNTLVMNYDFFSGSGLGYDMNLLLPVSLFANIAPTSRIIFGTGYGGAEAVFPGSKAQDGFEEWAYLPGTGVPRDNPVPEPGSLALLSASLLGLAVTRKHKQGKENNRHA